MQNNQNYKFIGKIFESTSLSRPNLTKFKIDYKSKTSNNLMSLSQQNQVKGQDQRNSFQSQDMDIDEQNDKVNQLPYIQKLEKADYQEELFDDLTTKQRILYANSKKHQGNQYFKQGNLQQAIESYKFGLALLKPQSFVHDSSSVFLAMAELTSNILNNMGTCYFILMSYRYAIRFYNEAILIKPNYIKALYNRALCHLQEGHMLLVFQDIKLVYSLDKDNQSICMDLKKIQALYLQTQRNKSSDRQSSVEVSERKALSKNMMQKRYEQFDYLSRTNQTYKSMINTKISSSNSPGSPKFYPYELNYHTTGQFKKIQNRIEQLQNKIEEARNKNEQAQQIDNKKQIHKNQLNKQIEKNRNDKFWLYVPILVATSLGLYHSLKAMLSK